MSLSEFHRTDCPSDRLADRVWRLNGTIQSQSKQSPRTARCHQIPISARASVDLPGFLRPPKTGKTFPGTMTEPSDTEFGSGQADQKFWNPYIDLKNRIHAHFSDRCVIDPEGTVDEIRRYVARQEHGFPLYWDADLTVILCEAYLLAGRPRQAMAAALRAERLGRQIDISPNVSPSLSESHRKSCEKMKERCATLVDEIHGILVEDYPQAFGHGAQNRAGGDDRVGAQDRDSSAARQSGEDEATGGNTAASADTSGPSEAAKEKSKRVDLSDFDECDEDEDELTGPLNAGTT